MHAKPSTPFDARRLLIPALAMATTLLAVPAAPAAQLYFADIFNPDFDSGSIRRVNLDGSGLVPLIPIGGGLRSFDINPADGMIYWTDVNNFVIRRASLGGTGQEDLITTGLEFPSAIAVDPAGGKMYWGDQVANELRRANLDGTNSQLLRSTFFHRGIAVDPVNGKVYWSTSLTTFRGEIERCNLDGSDPETVVTSLDAQFKPSAIALDIAGGKIYWTDYVVDIVRRANLNGTNIQTLFVPPVNHNPRGIALDLAAGKVYWGQDENVKGSLGKIMRMNLDGAMPHDFLTGLGLANYLVIGPDGPAPGDPADLNGDGVVDGVDLGILLSNWSIPPGAPGCRGSLPCDSDINDDGVVDGIDLGLLLAGWTM